jgi:exopolysaccharide biosynthesis polyprenyl glycosylphosphotransferase
VGNSGLPSLLFSGKRGHRTIVVLLIVLDALLLCLSWFCAYWLRFSVPFYFPKLINPFRVYLLFTPVMVLVWISVCSFFGLYRRVSRTSLVREFNAVFKAFLLGLLVSMSLAFLLKDLNLGRSVIIFMGGLSLVTLTMSRVIVRSIERKLWDRGLLTVRAIVVGAGESGIRTVQKLQDSREIGYDVAGFIDNDEKKRGKRVGGLPVLGREKDINDVIVAHDIGDVFFAIPNISHHRIFDIISSCPRKHTSFHIVTDVFDVISDTTPIDMIGSFPVVDLKGEGAGIGYEAIKRLMDIVISLSALVLTFPLWICAVIWIKIDSRGPVFFLQSRVGKNGKSFDIIKFRTMHTGTEAYARSPKSSEDSRITRSGRLLRKFSLDELPQLINVIAGDMSIVGPRPEMPFIVARYKEWEKKRLSVRPGITGLWQVIGRKDLPLEENIQYDFFYIKNRSLVMDISIILRTLPALLSRKGAY